MKRFKLSKLLIVALISGSLLVSCSDENILEPNNENLSLRSDGGRSNSGELFSISYDMDYTVMTKFNCDPTRFDLAAGTPTADKQNVVMTVMSDGRVNLVTESKVSKNEFSLPQAGLPNDLPKVKKTVLENNQMSLYDENGTLIRSIPDQSIQMPYFADKMRETLMYLDSAGVDISNILACLRANVNLDSLTSIINDPPDDVIVNQINDNIYTIRMKIPTEIAIPEAESMVNIVNITDKLLLGSRLYDSNGKTQQCMMFRYDDCILTGFKQEVYEELPDCEEAILQTIADISNLQFNFLQ